MAIWYRDVVAAWLVTLGCSGPHAEPVTTIDAAAPEVCSCCTSFAFTASTALDVASDGKTLYVTFTTAPSSRQQLGIVTGDGSPPMAIATADQFVLGSFHDTVFYAAQSGLLFELHERVGATDRMLGSVSSAMPIQIAGNATDLYVSASVSPDSATVWRFSRTAPAGTAPVAVTSEAGTAQYFALGSTVAAWATSAGSWLVSIPGPSTPPKLSESVNGLAFVGDAGLVFRGSKLTSRASSWLVEQIVPTTATVWDAGVIINGGLDNLLGDPSRVYWRQTSSSEATPNIVRREIMSSTLSGSVASLCTGWPSDVLRQDATHLLGLHNVSADRFAVEVVAKL